MKYGHREIRAMDNNGANLKIAANRIFANLVCVKHVISRETGK
jgi:hypothetical protein